MSGTCLAERLTPPVLRLLEGYWPAFVDLLRDRMISRWQKKLDALSSLEKRIGEALSRSLWSSLYEAPRDTPPTSVE